MPCIICIMDKIQIQGYCGITLLILFFFLQAKFTLTLALYFENGECSLEIKLDLLEGHLKIVFSTCLYHGLLIKMFHKTPLVKVTESCKRKRVTGRLHFL